jgi:RHS repeat-associated protein
VLLSRLLNWRGQTIEYTAFHKASNIKDTTMNDEALELDIIYGPEQQRWKSELKKDGIVIKNTIFAGDYEKITENGITRHLYYISGGDGLAAVYVKQPGTSDQTYYAHTDHLGSIVKLTDNNGTPVFQASYDAWGLQTLSESNTFTFHRGYTGHEHLPDFGLINMNGRMYHPVLGRFLSPDPFVQAPEYSQNFNRYSYCLNNPLIYTDPDGEVFWLIPAAIIVTKAAINVAKNWDHIKVAGNGWQAAGRVLGYAGIGAVDGAISYYAPGGGSILGGTLTEGLNSTMRGYSLKQIAINTGISFFSNAVGYGVGKGFSHLTKQGLSALNVTSPFINKILPPIIGNVTGDFAANTTYFYTRYDREYSNKGDQFLDALKYSARPENILSSVASGVVEGSIDYFQYRRELKAKRNTPILPPSPLDLNKSNTSPTIDVPLSVPQPIPEINPPLPRVEIFPKSPVPSRRPRVRVFDDVQNRWIYF